MTNFSVIKTGGKQYKVASGDKLRIEKLLGDYKVGDKLTFSEVLLDVKNEKVNIGTPITGGKVEAKILEIGKADTILVAKYKAKSRYFKKNGHRQPYFQIQVS